AARLAGRVITYCDAKTLWCRCNGRNLIVAS
ncbi:hypothetical protein EC950183_5751, partial [Escherichia coli 95.0183]